ncbi:hypothetical protein [Myroides odoratimimus]|uniref:Uncharacterized protein n=1 Tax=Myroides odoratimimus CIP 101113 TaxID=883154 RepID=A0AAV3F897_9FLAO|nr:hypothetical protein [Myroides odoratimimus]EHO15500.1 hypothetical protein HMPREF9715_00071 [Myroides odoratimimus CIP 101113]
MLTKIDTKCYFIDSRSKFVFQENGKKITLCNKDKVESTRIDVDGCAIKEGIRCDGMLKVGVKDLDIYIELKGSDVLHGADQIIRTKSILGTNKDSKGYIVCSSGPKVKTDGQNAKKKARAKGINLVIETIRIECDY